MVITVGILLLCAMPAWAQRDKKRKNNQDAEAGRLWQAEKGFIEAEKYFLLEDYAKALFYLQQVAELNPENPTVHYKMAQVLSKSNKVEDLNRASISAEYAIRLDAKNKYYYLLASQIYASLTNFNRAAELLETMMKEVKGTEEYLFELAALYQYDGRLNEAIETYDRSEASMGVNEVSSLQKQKLYFEIGKPEQALREGEKLLEAFPDEEQFVVGYAETLSRYNQNDKAIAVVKDYLKEHADAGSAKILLAGLYRDAGRNEDSRQLLLDAFDDPYVDLTSKIIVLSTYIEIVRGDPSDEQTYSFVTKLFEKLRVSDGQEPNVRLIGGDLFMALNQPLKARDEYFAAVSLGATSFDAWQNLLVLESDLDELDSVIAHSDMALELFPNQAMLYYFNGYAHLRKKNYRASVAALEQAKRLSSSDDALRGEIAGMLGDAYNGIENYQKSNQAYEEALAVNPNNYFVLNNYSYYLALRKESLEKAERMSALLTKDNPDNPTYLDTYAWVLFAREKYKEAKKVIEKAIESGDLNPAYFEHYGDILFKLGQTDEAVRQWQKAKSLNSDSELIDKKIANRRLY